MHLIPQCKRVRGPCMRWPDDDRISDLAHDVIVHILSFLSLKEAAKSSTLSRRWRYLWMYTYRRWDFDASKTLFLLPLNGNLRGERYKYVKWVSSVLKLHRSSHLEELRIRFDLSREHSIHMQRWVKFAIDKKVQRFELDLSSTPGDTPYSTHQSSLQPNKFLLPNLGQVIKNPNNLIYSGWDLKIDNGEAPFSQLKSLTLRSVEIYSDAVEYLLSNCPLLEHLCIERSKAMAFKIVGPPSLRLKSLEILHCLRLVQMEIYAPNLESFAYVGNMIQVPFKHVSNSISDLTLGMDYGLSFLSYPKRHVHYFKHVKKLAIDYFGDARYRRRIPENFPKMIYLKHVELRWEEAGHASLVYPLTLVKAAPSLCTFKMEIILLGAGWPKAMAEERLEKHEPYHAPMREAVAKIKHKCLKTVELSGFDPTIPSLDLVSLLIDISAESPLEKMVIKFLEEKGTPHALELLENVTNKLGPATELVICAERIDIFRSYNFLATDEGIAIRDSMNESLKMYMGNTAKNINILG